jgi:hypothetical protein
MRRFHLINRDAVDPAVAELVGQGVVFADGTTVVAWTAVSVEVSRQDPEAIARGEQLEVVWLDPEPCAAAATVRPLRVLGDPRG